MKVCIVGGVYGVREEVREALKVTPETTLEGALRERGVHVATFGLNEFPDLSGYDVVHVHHLGRGAVHAAASPGGAAFVYTSHDGRSLSGETPGLAKGLAASFVFARADAVVALSESEAAFQRGRYDLRGALHEVIPNGIDTSVYAFRRGEGTGARDPFRLLYVGQLIPLKRVDDLLRALAVLRHGAMLDLVYHVDHEEGALRRLAEELGVAGRVRFLGPKAPPELARAYREADALVLPSSAEALPSVVTEAMLCGTPVVATDVGSVRDQLGGWGTVVPPGSPERLAEGIDATLEDLPRLAAGAEEASRRAAARFSVRAMAERHEALYRRLVAAGPRRRHRLPRSLANLPAGWGVRISCVAR